MIPSIQLLLGTSIKTDGPELSVIKSIISAKDIQRKTCDSEILRAQMALEVLIKQRDDLLIEIDAHKAFLAPARRIFPEILGEIFLHCLPTDNFGQSSSCGQQPPILLTQVCRQWRQVALSCPRLWCNISSSVPQTRGTGLIVENTAEKWLELSRGCLLSLKVRDGGDRGQHDWSSAVGQFIQHSHRWNCVELYQPDNSLSFFDLSRVGRDTPWLASVDVTATRWKSYDDSAMERLAAVLGSSSRLRSFTWRSGWLDLHPSLLGIPWSQLVHVNIDCRISYDDFIEIFPRFICVESCSLRRVWGERSRGVLPQSTVVFPTMRKLHLSSAGNLALLLDNIFLPCITEVSIDHFNPSRNEVSAAWPQSSFISLFSRSLCQLQRLCIDVQACITESDVLECLRIASHTLVEVCFEHEIAITDKVVEALLPVQSSISATPGLCPKLKALKLHKCLSTKDGLLAKMVEARWRPDGEWTEYATSYVDLVRLEEVSFCMYSSRTALGHENDVRRLRRLFLSGLKGRIDHYVS